MAIKISNTTVIDDSARIVNVKAILPTNIAFFPENGVLTIDCSTGTTFMSFLTTPGSVAINFTNIPNTGNPSGARYSCILQLTVSAGVTVTWSNSTLRWPKGTAPALTQGQHLIVVTALRGTNDNTIHAAALTNFA